MEEHPILIEGRRSDSLVDNVLWPAVFILASISGRRVGAAPFVGDVRHPFCITNELKSKLWLALFVVEHYKLNILNPRSVRLLCRIMPEDSLP